MDKEAAREIPARLSGGPTAAQGGVGDCFLTGGDGGRVSRAWAGGAAWLPFGGGVQSQWIPCSPSGSSEVAVGLFLVSLYLFVHNLPQLCGPCRHSDSL